MISRCIARLPGVGLRGLATNFLAKPQCGHKGDHAKPETLPPPPQGTFKDTGAETHLEYYPTLEEQWPEIPAGMAMCNLEQFKSQAVYPGHCWNVWRNTCKYDVVADIQDRQLHCLLDLWIQSVPDSEVEKLPREIIVNYTV